MQSAMFDRGLRIARRWGNRKCHKHADPTAVEISGFCRSGAIFNFSKFRAQSASVDWRTEMYRAGPTCGEVVMSETHRGALTILGELQKQRRHLAAVRNRHASFIVSGSDVIRFCGSLDRKILTPLLELWWMACKQKLTISPVQQTRSAEKTQC